MVYRHSQVKGIVLALPFGLLFIGIAVYVNVHKPPGPPATEAAYGVNVDMTALIPGTAYTIATANGGDFFTLATQLGINTLRITDIQWEITGEEYPQAIWHHVFDEAEHYHMHVILLLMDGKGHSAIQQAHVLLDGYGLAHASALWLVDLYNEPNLSDSRLMTMLREEAAYVHQVAPGVPITIGGWKSQVQGHPQEFRWQNPTDIPRFINLVDVVSAHLYQFAQGALLGFTPQQWTQRFLSAVRHEAPHKPILLEEFGAGNGLASTTEPTATGSPEWQASVYRGVLQEVSAERDQGVIGALAWIIAPRPAWPHPNTNSYGGDMSGWAFVLNHGQRLLPASKIFSVVEHVEQQETITPVMHSYRTKQGYSN